MFRCRDFLLGIGREAPESAESLPNSGGRCAGRGDDARAFGAAERVASRNGAQNLEPRRTAAGEFSAAWLSRARDTPIIDRAPEDVRQFDPIRFRSA